MKKETTDYIFILEERTKGTWIYNIFVSVLRNQLRTETVRDRNHNLGLTELGEQKSWTYYNTISTSKGRELTSKSLMRFCGGQEQFLKYKLSSFLLVWLSDE